VTIRIERSGESTFFRTFHLDCAAATIQGPRKRKNEDAFLFAAPGSDVAERCRVGYLFGVADGVSADPGSSRASRLAMDVAHEAFADARSRTPGLRSAVLDGRLLEANRRLFAEYSGHPPRCMATLVWIWEDPEGTGPLRASWSHVGDTRLFRCVAADCRAVTEDHTAGGYVTRAVGVSEQTFRVDSGSLDLDGGDRLILASDGVWKFTHPMGSALPDTTCGAEEAVRALLALARNRYSQDDATAIVVRVEPKRLVS
jgi:serine/threonine protein phosphatase PrpC